LSILPRPPEEPAAAPRAGKRRPQARLRAVPDEPPAIADWASLFGDLARPSIAPRQDAPVEWRVHDRTHVEFAIDYPILAEASTHTWEAFFFVPESFRLDEASYDKKAIYDDLWSYVRYAVPTVPFFQLASRADGSALERAQAALCACAGKAEGSDEAAAAMRRLRLFACLVRASGLAAMREAERAALRDRAAATSFVASCSAVAAGLRAVLADALALELPDDVRTAARWTDEDVSLVIETFCATLGISLESRWGHDQPHAPGPADAGLEGRSDAHGSLAEVAEQLAAYAVKEARHRRDEGLDSVGSADAPERAIEHFEFRRHMLKRFTASVLWLSLEVHQAAAWVVHSLYALAAAVAMAFALAASMGTSPTANFVRYALPIIVAYAVKDRMKALLQSVFAGWIAHHFPDRKWLVCDERGARVGKVNERAAFVSFRGLPPEVLAARRLTREHALEEHARPERVLWHQKQVMVAGTGRGGETGDFSMLTEIFRLNLHRWLSHTDDPNRKIVFADPVDARVYSAKARRVYNINVVYRLRAGDAAAPWHRIRVVVSRKGIERIDSIC
jgi:hypothetical protein